MISLLFSHCVISCVYAIPCRLLSGPTFTARQLPTVKYTTMLAVSFDRQCYWLVFLVLKLHGGGP